MKKKRYQEGGEAEGISGTAGRMRGDKKPRTTDDMTFGQAFSAARKAGKSTFMWRGDKFNTELEKPAAKSAAKPAAKADDTPATGRSTAFEESRTVTPASEESSTPKKKKTFLGALASRFGTAAQRKRGAEEGYKAGDIGKSIKAGLGTQRMREELADEYEGAQVAPTALMGLAGGAAGMGGRAALRYGARRLGGGAAGRRGESLAQRRIREAREAREARLDEKLAADMEGGFKRGGGVKKYNKGGKIDGIAKRGKTRCRII